MEEKVDNASPLVTSDLVKHALAEKEGSSGVKRINWRRLFVIEIYLTLVLALYMSASQIVQQYIFQTFAREALSDTPNYTAPNHSICLRQDYIVNHTGSNASIIQVQKKANNLAMYLEVIGLGASAVMALLYGSLSDIIGRKPILTVALAGLSLSCALQVAVVQFDLNMYIYFVIAAGIHGVLGGTATFIGVCFAAVSDVATKKWRTLRLGTTESAIGFGKALSYLLVYYWINKNGCDFRGPAYLLLGIIPISFIYLIMLPESLPPKERRKEGGFKKLANGAKIFFLPSKTGFSKWWRIWICVAIISIECLCVIGIYQVLNYFLHNKPLEWSYDLIGIYGIVTAMSLVIALVFVLPLLISLPIPERFLNPFLILLGAMIAVGTNVMMATVKTDWEMFLAGIIQTLQQIAFPAVRGILSGLVATEDYGAILTITASIQMFASMGSTVLFNKVYHPEAEVNGHHYNAGIVFWITAGLWAAVVPLVILLFKRRSDSTSPLTGSKTKNNYGAVN